MTIRTIYHASTGGHWWIVRASPICVAADGSMANAIALAVYLRTVAFVASIKGWRTRRQAAGERAEWLENAQAGGRKGGSEMIWRYREEGRRGDREGTKGRRNEL